LTALPLLSRLLLLRLLLLTKCLESAVPACPLLVCHSAGLPVVGVGAPIACRKGHAMCKAVISTVDASWLKARGSFGIARRPMIKKRI
jgi:hypothetical protein